ncbi:MAG: SDR family NAD(P)-dependent oxidoreductase, partial [Edaphobacter sp.]
MDKLLKGKTVLVTGAARRIGRTIALALAERGASVAITYLTSQPEAENTVHALAAHDVDALAICCDLRDPESIQQTMSSVIE